MVTIVESLLNDILRLILSEYPSKIASKRKVDLGLVLEAVSIEEMKLNVVDSILNDMAYKSPRDYAGEFEKYTGVRLLESPPFHRFIELKATRDIHIHNSGIANQVYLAKAGTSSRVRLGEYVVVDLRYFLESYEQCLRLVEVLQAELDKIWPTGRTKSHF